MIPYLVPELDTFTADKCKNLKSLFELVSLAQDVNKLHTIETPSGKERDQLQEVDELVAKAISFRNVSKVGT